MNKSAPKAGQTKRELAWRDRLNRQAASGLGVAAFCEHESVSTASFYRWRTLLAGQARAFSGASVSTPFIDLGAMRPKDGVVGAVPSTASEPGVIEVSLDLGHGLLLRIVRR